MKKKGNKRQYNIFLIVGIVIVLTAIFIAVFCPIITKYDPLLVNVEERITAPTGQHKLGTDEMGRDVLSRMFFGVRASMIIGVSVAIISTMAGIIVGVIAGYYNKVDNVLMRILDGVMAFPSIIIAIALAGILGTGKINIIIALSVAYFPTMARIVRSSVLSLRDIEYVQSIKVLGASDVYIIIHHIIPNIISPIIVQMTFIFALAVFDEAALSYLGVGIRAPEPSLGGMVSDARKYMSVAPWTILYPGLMIAYIVLGLNLLGDGLRDYFDPKLNEK
ncbi:ABC transporter permease [Dorea formicigenerans]|jgi:peptide/nickel transport system permease protein|uniref:ABC transporter permease n=1 Tax=Dorea formicigenerans TaxID=39486 RepID=A0A412MD24_9FIRM|nr:ABC transporter permease [Dorea formicigenerans]RGT07643.1 ABC transporter permease [Dorea formicigenerans]RHE27010.1 ABC transporter permease [Dorea formicigenerans]